MRPTPFSLPFPRARRAPNVRQLRVTMFSTA